MKISKYFLIVLSLLIFAVFSYSQQDTDINGEAIISTQDVSKKNGESSKFNEYRDIQDGGIFDRFFIHIKKGDYFFDFNAERAGRKDERFQFSFAKDGKYRLNYQWDKIPHIFSYEARTPYTETSPRVWGLPDNLQNQIQTILGDKGTNLPQAMNTLSSYLNTAHKTPLEIGRRRQKIDYLYDFSVHWGLSVNFEDEREDGYKAIGAALGYGNVMELPEIVDYNTRQGEVSLHYFKKNVSVNFGVNASKFENNNLSMEWDNPYRLTDQTPPGDLTYLLGNGSGIGRLSLPPENSVEKAFFNANFKIFKRTTIKTIFSYSHLSQDSKLLPYTSNSGLALVEPLSATSPRPTAGLKVNISNANISIHSYLSSYLTLNAGYKYYDFNNSSEEFSIPGYALLDQNWIAEPGVVSFINYTRRSYYVNFILSLWATTSFEIGYKNYEIDRKKGGLDKGKNNEKTFYCSIVTTPLDWLTFKGSYSMGRRDWSLENGGNVIYHVRNDALFPFRRYYEAERDRDEANLYLSITPIKDLDLSLSYKKYFNDYKKSGYGLKSDNYYTYSFDISYNLKKHSIYAFYTKEKNKGFQANRETSKIRPLDVISNDPLNDWTALLTDTTDTYGGGINLNMKENKLFFNLSFVFSKTDGNSFLESPVGGEPDEAFNFTKGLDSTKFTYIEAKMTYILTKNLKLMFGEWYEKWTLDDIILNDLKVDMLKSGYAFYLGALEPGYKNFITYAKISYSW